MDSIKRTRVVGTILIAIFIIIFILIGLTIWIPAGFFSVDDLEYVGYIALVSMALGTAVNLLSRRYQFNEGTSIRMLFTLMSVSFITISSIFLYYIMDRLLAWANYPTLSEMINTIPSLEFYLFGIEDIDISMPIASIVSFAFIMLGVSFFIYPLEKFVKDRKPWFALSLWISLAFIPFLAFLRDNLWVVSIATVGIVFFVLINFIFLFYLYISLAVKSAGAMRKASVLVAMGLFSMIFVWVMGIGIFSDKMLQNIVQFSIGAISMTMFNLGFHIMRS